MAEGTGGAGAPIDVASTRLRGPVEKAYQHVQRLLELREVLPGDRLPAAALLATNIGVSRGAVLQALQVMQAEGRLVVRPGRGGARAEALHASRDVRWARIMAKRDGLAEMLAFIELIQTGAAHYAARRGVDRAAVATLREAVAAMRETTDVDAWLGAENRFHIEMAGATGSQIYRGLMIAVRLYISSGYDFLEVAATRRDQWAGQHESLLTAVLAGDAAAAVDLAARYCDQINPYLQRAFGPDIEPAARRSRRPTRGRASPAARSTR